MPISALSCNLEVIVQCCSVLEFAPRIVGLASRDELQEHGRAA